MNRPILRPEAMLALLKLWDIPPATWEILRKAVEEHYKEAK